MSWNYRVMRFYDGTLEINEVFYKDGKPDTYCDANVQGETLQELTDVLRYHQRALKKPILDVNRKGKIVLPEEST